MLEACVVSSLISLRVARLTRQSTADLKSSWQLRRFSSSASGMSPRSNTLAFGSVHFLRTALAALPSNKQACIAQDIGLGALFLASKLEESPLRIRDLINVSSYLSALLSSASTPSQFVYEPMDYFASEFYDLKDALVIAEMQILKRLGFQTQCGLGYGHLVNYLRILGLVPAPATGATADDDDMREGEREGLVGQCWGYLNDMSVDPFPSRDIFYLLVPDSPCARCRSSPRLQTGLPALYAQSTLAIGAIYLCTRLHAPPLALPLAPVPWWTHFDTTETELLHVCSTLLALYRRWGSWPQAIGAEEEEEGRRRMSVWERGRGLPMDKKGVRARIEEYAAERAGRDEGEAQSTNGSGRADLR